MTQSSLPWDGEITGDCGAYSADVWDNMMEETLLGGQAGAEGVIAGVASELLPSTPGTVRVDVAAGRAIVKGKYYRNTATVPVPIPLVAGGAGHTRIDRVVLRAAWLGTTEVPASPEQTVRVFRIEGVEDSGVPPAIVPNDGDTWDLMICQAAIDGTTGVITITDERDFIHPVSPVYRRQGGDPIHWSVAGLTNYTPGRSVIQCGVVHWAGAADVSGAVAVTFPVTYPAAFPIALAINLTNLMQNAQVVVQINNMSLNGFEIDWQSWDAVTTWASLDFVWIAIGAM